MFDKLERKIIGGILGIKLGTKTTTEVAPLITQMKGINAHMGAELEQKYIKALTERKEKA